MSAARSAFDLLVIGDANPDMIVRGASPQLVYGQAEQLAEHATLTIGGSAGITAAAAARLGLRTALAGVVGNDAAGGFMRQALAQSGVNVDGLVARDGLSTGLSVAFTRGDDRAIVTFPGSIAALVAGDVPPRLLATSRHVHVTSFFLQRRLATGLRALFEAVHAHGATTSLDLNWDPAGEWNGGVDDVLPAADVLFVNGAEAAALSGTDDPAAAATALLARGPLPVIKLGAAGALAHDGCRLVRVSAPAVDVVDTVGAGDTFDGGFLCGRLLGWDVARSLALGVVCGSLSTRAAGGVEGQPSREEAVAAL